MSGSIYDPGTSINVNSQSSNAAQEFIATAGQVVFTLTGFTYTPSIATLPNTGAIAIYRNGQRLLRSQYTEVDTTTVALVGIVLAAGESINIVAVVGDTSSNAAAAAASAASAASSAALLAAAAVYTIKNKFINSFMEIDQRNEGANRSIIAGAALAYVVDRWYGYCTGANVTGRPSVYTNTYPIGFEYTGAAGCTKIAHAQRIEAANCIGVAGQNFVTLQMATANSLLNTVDYKVWYANTPDAFGTLVAPTKTLITSGTFTGINAILSVKSVTFSVPLLADGNGLEVEFSVGAQISGTWGITGANLVIGQSVISLERLPAGMVLQQCQRYYEKSFSPGIKPVSNPAGGVIDGFVFPASRAGAVNQNSANVPYQVTKRVQPTITTFSPNFAASAQVYDLDQVAQCSALAIYSIGYRAFTFNFTGNAGTLVGNRLGLHWTAECEIP